jgi:hypothetical protein
MKKIQSIMKEDLNSGSGEVLTRKISHYRKLTSSMNLGLFEKTSQKKK